MALVGSLSGTLETGIVAITGSLIPSSTTHNLGSNSFKWGSVYANNITGSVRSTAAGSDFIVAGPNATVNYNSSGQWEITGASSVASIFTAATANAAYTTSSIAIGFSAAASSKGSNVFFAVSGSDPASNTALFSGEIVTSGSILVKNTSADVTAQITNAGVISGSALQSLGNLNVQGSSGLIGNVTVTGDVAVNGGDITTSAATFNIAAGAATVNVGSSTGVVVIPGDLEVRGTTMTVSASNLVIEDPIVGFGFLSGSTAIGTGDRGFIGGISGAGNNVAFGWSNSNSAFVATRTTSTPEDVTITVSALQPIRASKLEVNGTTAYVTSSAGTDIQVVADAAATVKGTTDSVILDGASGKGVSFNIAGSPFAQFKDNGANAQFGAVPTKALTVSGTTVTLDTNAATNFTRNGARVGQLIGTDGIEFKLAAMNNVGTATNLVLSGSGVDLSANTQGINLNFAGIGRGTISYGSNILQIGTVGTPAAALSLSGTNGVILTHGTNGTSFVKDGGTSPYLIVEADGASPDARLRAVADLVLRADGNDIKFNNGTQTVLTLTTAGNNANFQGANNQQVNIGSVGSGGMTVSGSTVTANVGAGGFVFQRDGVVELLVNAVGSTTTISGSTSQNVTLAAGTGATILEMSGSTTQLRGGVITMFKDTTKISEITTIDTRTGFFPGADSSFDLGGPSRRWANIYTGDLHLRNERGDYTLIEESDFLSIRFNKNGKRYKFLLERVPELDER